MIKEPQNNTFKSRTLTEILEFAVNRLDGANDSPRFVAGMQYCLTKDNNEKIYIFNVDKCQGIKLFIRSKYKLADNDILFKDEKDIILKSINEKYVKFRINKVNGRKIELIAMCVLANYFPLLQTNPQKQEENKEPINAD